MALRRSELVLLIGTAVAGLSLNLIAQSQETFKVRLTPIPIDNTMRTNVVGSGTASAVLSGTKLTITGSFTGLRTPATVARLHRGLATGVRGSAFADLGVANGTSGTISGSLDLTPEYVDSLRKGRLYIQIHSEKAPDGNLWGWILK
jgi:hypothetical protein